MNNFLFALLIFLVLLILVAIAFAWLFERACIAISKLNNYIRVIYRAKHPRIYKILKMPYKLIVKWLFSHTS